MPLPYETMDTLLASLVNKVNRTNTSAPITVVAGGQVITGTLVSGAQWARAVAEQIIGDRGEQIDADSAVGGLLETLGEEATAESIPRLNEMPSYLHLIKATYVVGGRAAPGYGPGIPWRGRVNQVSGWSFGVLRFKRADGLAS